MTPAISVPLSEDVVVKLLSLKQLEEGKRVDFSKCEEQVARLRYEVAELLMASTMKQLLFIMGRRWKMPK